MKGDKGRNGVALLLQASGLTEVVGAILDCRWLRGPMIRAVNYHGTPEAHKKNLQRHVEYYKKRYTIFDEVMLEAFLCGALPLNRTGLILSFDDGLKSHYTVAADVLDSFGIKGFFFIPVGFINLADQGQEKAKAFYLRTICGDRRGAGLQDEDCLPMSWENARDLVRRGHVLGCHGLTHTALLSELGRDELYQEIVESKRIMESRLGVPITSFCWPLGTPSSYSKAAYDVIRQHYRFAFTTFASPLRRDGDPYSIDRSNVEAHMCLARIKCAVRGVTELYFKNRRVKFEAIIR